MTLNTLVQLFVFNLPALTCYFIGCQLTRFRNIPFHLHPFVLGHGRRRDDGVAAGVPGAAVVVVVMVVVWRMVEVREVVEVVGRAVQLIAGHVGEGRAVDIGVQRLVRAGAVAPRQQARVQVVLAAVAHLAGDTGAHSTVREGGYSRNHVGVGGQLPAVREVSVLIAETLMITVDDGQLRRALGHGRSDRRRLRHTGSRPSGLAVMTESLVVRRNGVGGVVGLSIEVRVT